MKNKEPIILAVVVFFTLVLYYLVEPYAHHVMHKQIASENFVYADLPAIEKQGDVARGAQLVMGVGACVDCHSINVVGLAPVMDAVTSAKGYGVNPPDLSNVGVIYDEKFLAHLIKNPIEALKVEHKYGGDTGLTHPMMAFSGAGGDLDQELADMVAYLKSIAMKQEEVTPKLHSNWLVVDVMQ